MHNCPIIRTHLYVFGYIWDETSWKHHVRAKLICHETLRFVAKTKVQWPSMRLNYTSKLSELYTVNTVITTSLWMAAPQYALFRAYSALVTRVTLYQTFFFFATISFKLVMNLSLWVWKMISRIQSIQLHYQKKRNIWIPQWLLKDHFCFQLPSAKVLWQLSSLSPRRPFIIVPTVH